MKENNPKEPKEFLTKFHRVMWEETKTMHLMKWFVQRLIHMSCRHKDQWQF